MLCAEIAIAIFSARYICIEGGTVERTRMVLDGVMDGACCVWLALKVCVFVSGRARAQMCAIFVVGVVLLYAATASE